MRLGFSRWLLTNLERLPSSTYVSKPFLRLPNHYLHTTGVLTAVGFGDFIERVESILVGVHINLSLPWWAVIAGTTLALRSVLTVPLAIHQQKVGVRLELLKPVLTKYVEAIKHNVVVKCRRENLPVEEANRRIRKEVTGILLIGRIYVLHITYYYMH